MIDRIHSLLVDIMTDEPDVVIIENQLQRAHTLRVIQYAIHSWVRGHFGTRVKLVYQSGAVKFKLGSPTDIQTYEYERNNATSESAKYKVNKQYGLKIARSFMGDDWFNKNTKNDDMADALCHVLYYAQFKTSKPAVKSRKRATVHTVPVDTPLLQAHA